MQTQELLKKAGLSEREIKVYLAGLKSGPILATKLAQKAGISRTNVYGILRSLGNKGLVSKGSKSYNKHFIMELPTVLQGKIEQRADALQILGRELKVNLATFEILTPTSELIPKVKIFEGKEGIKSMIDEIFKTPPKEIKIVRGGRNIEEILGNDFIDEFMRKRMERGVKSRVVRKKDVLKTTLKEDQQKLRQSRNLPKGVHFNTTMIIYGDKILVISSKEEDLGFIIQSKELSHFFSIFFEMLWKASSKLGE